MTDKSQASAEDIMSGLGDALGQYQPFHNQVLVGIFIRPNMTAGGILLPDSTRDEDRWQGKVGLVLAKGPMAFVDDARNDFKGQNVEVGDWIVFRVSDGFSIDINKVHCRMLEDIHIRGRVTSPEIIW